MNKKGQVLLDRNTILAAITIFLVGIILIPLLNKIVTLFQKPVNVEDIIFPLILLAIFFQMIRRIIR